MPRRSGHSATALPDGRILVFGGVDETGAYRNDAFLVDPDRSRWLALKGGITRGAPPKPRAYHRFVNASPQDVQAYHVLQVDKCRHQAGGLLSADSLPTAWSACGRVGCHSSDVAPSLQCYTGRQSDHRCGRAGQPHLVLQRGGIRSPAHD